MDNDPKNIYFSVIENFLNFIRNLFNFFIVKLHIFNF